MIHKGRIDRIKHVHARPLSIPSGEGHLRLPRVVIPTAVEEQDRFARRFLRPDHKAGVPVHPSRFIDCFTVCRFFIRMLPVVFPRSPKFCLQVRIRTFDEAAFLDRPHGRYRDFCTKTQGDTSLTNSFPLQSHPSKNRNSCSKQSFREASHSSGHFFSAGKAFFQDSGGLVPSRWLAWG